MSEEITIKAGDHVTIKASAEPNAEGHRKFMEKFWHEEEITTEDKKTLIGYFLTALDCLYIDEEFMRLLVRTSLEDWNPNDVQSNIEKFLDNLVEINALKFTSDHMVVSFQNTIYNKK